MKTPDESLRWRLRGLRQDTPPERDLWPAIAERIAASPRSAEPASVSLGRPWVAWAVAASVLLSVGLVWQKQMLPDAGESPYQREAIAMTREYEGALAQFGGAETPAELAPAFEALDRSASQIRSAIATDPNARFLLEQLRRTYARRLALSQRAVMT